MPEPPKPPPSAERARWDTAEARLHLALAVASHRGCTLDDLSVEDNLEIDQAVLGAYRRLTDSPRRPRPPTGALGPDPSAMPTPVRDLFDDREPTQPQRPSRRDTRRNKPRP